MRVEPYDLSALPYKPVQIKRGGITGIGHPDLVHSLVKLLNVTEYDQELKIVVLKKRPNLILQTSLSAGNGFPWPKQVIKRFKWRGIQNFLLSPLKDSKAFKSYLAACHLLRHGLLTPMPLGAVNLRKLRFIRSNVYVTESIENYIDLKSYRDSTPHGPAGMTEVLKMLAEYVTRMHDSGLLHRDLNLSNFLLAGARGEYKLYLIDLNRCRLKSRLSSEQRAIDLARLDLKTWQELFFRHYCSDRFDQETMLRIANLCRFRRHSWRQVAKRTNNFRKRMKLK